MHREEFRMNVKIKEFNVEMVLKNRGIEFEVRDTHGDFLGDLVLTKTKIIWCRGKTDRKNGKSLSLSEFIAYMEAR